jgi:uncharacterized membrane protein YfcA
MNIYLPIAELSVNIFGLLALGGVAGILSGMFGVGGGFLTTPFLIFLGINPAVAVASSANQIIASSLSGFFVHWKRKNVDFRMGLFLLIGDLIGSTLGVLIFRWLKTLGQIDLVISLLYVTLLGSIGAMMAWESYRSLHGTKHTASNSNRTTFRQLVNLLPWKVRFPHSKLYISAILPISLGFFVGILISIMGIGGGFFMIPAMIYLLGMPTSIVVGTSLFQIIFTTINVTILHAISTHTVDIVLAVLLLVGSTIGAQIGSRTGSRIPAAQLRGALALMALAVAVKLVFGLVTPPEELYEVSVEYTR